MDGELDRESALDWLQRYAVTTRERASDTLDSFERYRTYVINHTLGEELVQRYVESRAGDDVAARWRVFVDLLTHPVVPADLGAGSGRSAGRDPV